MLVMTHKFINRQFINLILKMFFIQILTFIPWEIHEMCIKVYYQCYMWLACPSAYSPSHRNASKTLTGFQGPPVLRGGMAVGKS